jgi:hypothetical protein
MVFLRWLLRTPEPEPRIHPGRQRSTRRSVNEVGMELLHHWFLPQRSAPLATTGSEVLVVVPLEVTDALLDEFRRLADRHERGFMVEHVMDLLARG